MRELDPTLRVAIDEAVEAQRDATTQLLQELVRTPSVTGAEGDVQKLVERELQDRGLAVERCTATVEQIEPYRKHVGEQTDLENRPNIIGVKAGRGGGRSLLLNAHVDTVENGDPDTWTHGPLSGEVVDGLLYGRGSCDMKGGLVTHIAALDALESAGIELGGDAIVAATVGEEDGGVGALSTILCDYSADAALITEPTRLALVRAHGGGIVFRLTIPGRSTHAAERDRGISALEKSLPIFEDLKELEQERNATAHHPLFEEMGNKAPVNIGLVRSGNWAVTVPESLVAEGRVGLIPGEDLDASLSWLANRIKAVADRDPWLREHPIKIEWLGGQTVPAEVPADAPICEAVACAHGDVTGQKPRVEGVTYGADMRLFIEFGQVPCVMYGAGDVGIAHGPDEHLALDELLTATKTVAHLLADWCGVAE